MIKKTLFATFLLVSAAAMALPGQPAYAAVRSVTLISAFATLPGETAQIGRFESSDRIDLLFRFDLDADSADTAHLAWDVYGDRHRNAYSGSQDMPCQPGSNELRVEGAIPTNLGAGLRAYSVYASVRVGDEKDDTTFQIRIQNQRAVPYVTIEDVKLTPNPEDPLAEDLRGAAIHYDLEIDFRVESILDFGYADIRWIGETADGFVLDRGVGTISAEAGYNRFTTDSYLARPPSSAIQQADFSVMVEIMGYTDSVTFPISSLPFSLLEYRSRVGVEPGGSGFSLGEAYFVTEDGARATVFNRDEKVTARLLSAGIVPEDTTILMGLTDRLEETTEEFTLKPEPGTQDPDIDFELPDNPARVPGVYHFVWDVVIGGGLYAERNANVTLSGRTGESIPKVIDLPGSVEFAVPFGWDLTEESEGGRFATMVTPDGVMCELFGQSSDEPLHAAFLADIFESDPRISDLPADKTRLTEETDQKEATWEYVRRAYLGDGRVFVMNYWLYRVGEGEYEFLIARCTASENQIEQTYSAADQIKSGLDLGD